MNKFMVGSRGDNVVIMKPVPQTLSPDDALLLAAWLVSVADALQPTDAFSEVLAAVQG